MSRAIAAAIGLVAVACSFPVIAADPIDPTGIWRWGLPNQPAYNNPETSHRSQSLGDCSNHQSETPILVSTTGPKLLVHSSGFAPGE